jgi:hypothetical protein
LENGVVIRIKQQMANSNRNRTPAEFTGIEAELRAERHEASPLELDRIKLQAIRQAERSRPSLYVSKKGSFMKSRLALTLVLVAGFMLSTTGATLAISGSSSSGSASGIEYTPTGGNNPAGNNQGDHPQNHVKGVNSKGGNGPSNTSGGPSPEVVVAPAAAEQQAVVSNGSSLPFTGFVAIPLLVIGLALIVGGAVLRLKSRNTPVAKH